MTKLIEIHMYKTIVSKVVTISEQLALPRMVHPRMVSQAIVQKITLHLYKLTFPLNKGS